MVWWTMIALFTTHVDVDVSYIYREEFPLREGDRQTKKESN